MCDECDRERRQWDCVPHVLRDELYENEMAEGSTFCVECSAFIDLDELLGVIAPWQQR